MLLLESILEHGQLLVLLIALLFDSNFTSVLLAILAKVCPLFNPLKLKTAFDVVRNPHVFDSVPSGVADADLPN